MKNIEEIIRDNIEAFNSDEPSDEHFNRFKRKLQRHKNKVLYWKFSLGYRIAGIFIIAAILSGVLYFTGIINTGRAITSIGDISDEYYEVEMYYKGKINDSYDIIKKLHFMDNGNTRSDILSELKEMDIAYKDLQKDLAHNPCDERVINAIITYYQYKIEFMDQIIAQTKEYNI
jgi:hypothetical protein